MTNRSILPLLAPAAFAALPTASWLWLAGTPAAGEPRLRLVAFVCLGAAALLGWRFQRSRVAAAAIILAMGLVLVRRDPSAARMAQAVVPVLLGLLAMGADRRLVAPRGLLQVAIGVGALSFAGVLLPEGWLDDRLFGVVPAAVACTAAGLVLLVVVATVRRRPVEAGLLWAAGAGAIALSDAGRQDLWMAGAGLALGVAALEAAYALAFRDELTDLPGRRALSSLLSSVRAPYVVAVVDVDHFKRVNDRFGHETGDQVLRMVASRLAGVGGGGRAFRSGGEEFTLVFPGRSRDEALPHLEALRRAVAERPFVPRGPVRPPRSRGVARRGSGKSRKGLRVTISVGVAASPARGASADSVVQSADRAMYRAKQAGRNRVTA